MTFAIPGLGQVSAGFRRRGIIWFVVAAVTTGAAVLSLAMPMLVPALVLVVPVSLLINVWCYVDAYRCGRRGNTNLLPSPLWRYIAGILIVALAAIMSPQLLLANFVRNNVVEAFRTSSQAMAPTLVPGDCILCHKRAAAPARWSAVVYRPPHRPAEQYVSRVAGLPGETIEIRDGQVHVDGVAHPPPSGFGPYLSETSGFMRGGPGTHGKPITLGRDEYYLLGDNSPLAVDSRFFPVAYAGHQRGAVPRDKIVGRATYRYWPPARWRGL